MNEIELVERIRQWSRSSSKLVLGIGDDCAIVRPRAGEDLLFTTDQMIEDVHFRREHKPAMVGERALARSLSDIAAMGGEPRFCLVALATPAKHEKWIEWFYRGLLRMAKGTGTALAGGDLARAEKFHCDVMVCGAVKRGKALRRDGAKIGDAIYVSGRLGRAWDRKIVPRLALGQSLVGRATRGAELDGALHGGEDYELLFTMPPKLKAPKRTTRIGTMVRGKPGAVVFQGRPLEPRGWDHFA
jgi:thiamine-monophosphate kinase